MQGNHTASVQEARFMENLEQEKEKFSKTLLRLLEDFEDIKLFDNYKKFKQCHQDVATLKEKITESQDKVRSFNDREKLFKL